MNFDRSSSAEVMVKVVDGPPSKAVIEVVATAEDRDPLDLDPLYDAVDPGRLDRFLENWEDIAVTFPYEGYMVTVDDNADVALRTRE